jgi:uncharacterized membrane protein
MARDVTIATEVNRPAIEVFNFLADGENMPRWMDQIDSVVQTSPGGIAKGTAYKYKLRRGPESTFEWSQFEPNRRLAWSGPPIEGTVGSLATDGSYTLEERDGSTRVTVAFRPELGGLKKLIRPMMRRSLRHVFESDFERLRGILETRPQA